MHAVIENVRNEVDLIFQKPAYEMQIWRVREELGRVTFDVDDLFEWLGSRKAGVFLVLLVQSQVLDQFVVICGLRVVIVDIFERCNF